MVARVDLSLCNVGADTCVRAGVVSAQVATNMVAVEMLGEKEMIRSVTAMGLPQLADGQKLEGLKELNFIFGPNGSGKTTMSKLLHTSARTPSDAIEWSDGANTLDIRVYNRDFIAQTLAESHSMPGVFLLTEESADTRRRLVELEGEDTAGGLIGSGEGALKRLRERHRDADDAIEAARATLLEAAWKARKAFPEELDAAWDGYRADKAKFLSEVMRVRAAALAQPEPLEELIDRAATVFEATAAPVAPLADVVATESTALPNADLLSVEVVGNDSVPIAALITELGNSDWVRKGKHYLDASHGKCPFCQQRAPESLADELADYFSDRYAGQIAALEALQVAVAQHRERARTALSAVTDDQLRFLDRPAFELAWQSLQVALDKNEATIRKKLENPSECLEFVSTAALVADVQVLVEAANIKIGDHNSRIAGRKSERPRLIEDCWNTFVGHTVKILLTTYDAALEVPMKTRDGLAESIETQVADIAVLKAERTELLKHARSSAPVVERINDYLKSFGIANFTISSAPKREGHYALVRDNGQPVADTLSEGERTFISFLYFYFSLQGAAAADGDVEPTVAVIDDPISSLDSRVTWAVSQLIRRLMSSIVAGGSHVKQLLLLTHNAHFFNEITYVRAGEKALAGRRTFATFQKKTDATTEIVMHERSPIKSTYRALWHEVRRAAAAPTSTVTGIQNTMRRILESYFKLVGATTYDRLDDRFTGAQLDAYRSFLSWANDGSHIADLSESDYSMVGVSLETQLEVFEAVFVHTGHGGHFAMMMGVDSGEPSSGVVS